MYKTPKGERTLQGAERRLFTESLGMIADCLSLTDYESGIQVFDDLQRNQKIAVLLGMGKGLLRDNVSPPPLTAIGEAAVAAVYRLVEEQLLEEIGNGDDDYGPDDEGSAFEPELESAGTPWYELVWDACQETMSPDELPRQDDIDKSTWMLLVECLQDRVLWDADFEMTVTLDADPDQGQAVRDLLGIADEYYVWVPPEPDDETAAQMLNDLFYLTPEGRNLGNSSGPE